MRFRWIAVCGLALGMTALAAAPKGGSKAKDIKVDIKNKNGSIVGTASFKTVKDGVQVKIETKGLPFGPHAVHIHQNAVCDAPDFKGAGPHFNPDGKQHGYLNPMGHHNGDFPGGIDVDEDHIGNATFVMDSISLEPTAPNSVFVNGGTAIIIHEKADDDKTDPSGNAGNRIACGVIKQ
jgi:Cu-Zn family superoxide dismutase